MMLGLLLTTMLVQPDTLPDGAALIARMQARYADSWYETLALIQAVTYFDSSGAVDHAEVWYESLALPGTVRSDVAPLDQGRGEVFRSDSIFRFDADTLVQRGAAIHVVLLLGFDVYRQPAGATVEKLERYGFDLSVLQAADWDGRAGWMVGADDGPRFWVDAEHLLVRRLVVPGRADGRVRDIRFNDYEPLGGGWIATELVFLTDGQMRIRERYAWWDIGLRFDPSLFATRNRSRPAWVRN